MGNGLAQPADFDEMLLADWLDGKFGPASFQISRISGGQSNPTYFVDHGTRRMVLRKKPSGPILRGAHAIEREYRVMQALAGTPVPVPEMILLNEDAEPLGTPFYLMERLPGRVFHDASLSDAGRDERRGIYFAMAETLAKLHAVDPDAAGLADFGRAGSYFERQFSRWSGQYAQSSGKPIAAIEEIIEWLGANMPEDDGLISIAHGDFRLGNLLFDMNGPTVTGVLDWELSTLGHPMADLGFCCMPWVTSPEEYGGILGIALEAEGIPAMREFVDRYAETCSGSPTLQPFHVAFALFRFAVIFVGIADRNRAGTAAGANAARLTPLAERFALRALEVVQRNSLFG